MPPRTIPRPNIYLGLRPHKYCKDKGTGSYIGPWAFFEDAEWSEKEQIVIGGSNLKSHE